MWFCKYNLRRQGNVILKGDRENENREKEYSVHVLQIFFTIYKTNIRKNLV